MTIQYNFSLEKAIESIGLGNKTLPKREYYVSSVLNPQKTLLDIISLDPSLETGIHLDFVLYDADWPYTIYHPEQKSSLLVCGDPVFFDSPFWTPEGVHNNNNLFLLLLKCLYGNIFKRPSGIEKYDQQRMIELHFSETWKNIVAYSDYGMPSGAALWASQIGFIFSLRQKGTGFNAREVDVTRKIEKGGAGFLGYRKTNGVVFFDDPIDTHEIFFMYYV